VLADIHMPHLDGHELSRRIEAFGANRSMFESNFPVDKGACSYPVLFNAFKRLASGASPSEKADLLAGVASRFYRLRI
jgi:L-fuconolactonase